jgi:hypothetical protein
MTRSPISPATSLLRSIDLPAARRLLPRTIEARCALLVFVSVAALVAAMGRGERSGWILMTSPTEHTHQSNTMLGYSDVHGGRPIHKENVPTFSQVRLFRGAPGRLDMYAVRPIYAWIASPLTALVGLTTALLLVNLVAWAAAAYIAWRLTIDLLGDPLAGVLAVVLVAGGIGMTAHVADYSAHLLSFTFYYAGVLVLFRSGVWREAQPLETHLALGCFLALAALQYNTGLLLAVAMVAAAIGKQRWWHVTVAAALALAAQRVWMWLLNVLNMRVNGAHWQVSTRWRGHTSARRSIGGSQPGKRAWRRLRRRWAGWPWSS